MTLASEKSYGTGTVEIPHMSTFRVAKQPYETRQGICHHYANDSAEPGETRKILVAVSVEGDFLNTLDCNHTDCKKFEEGCPYFP